jgi:hypothetical protein
MIVVASTSGLNNREGLTTQSRREAGANGDYPMTLRIERDVHVASPRPTL